MSVKPPKPTPVAPPSALIRTKLAIPRLPPRRVPRPRLVERLGQSMQCALTLVIAPAGYGKTSLVGEWLASLNGGSPAVAWLTLDERDNDLDRFTAYLSAALSAAGLSLSEVQPGAGPNSPVPLEIFLTDLINRASRLSRPLLLVLDDLQALDSPLIFDGLAFLIENLPIQLHLVFISRAEIPLPVGQLRARGQLLELGIADLRFTPDEMRLFLSDTMQLDLKPEAFARLQERTEGWIAGLQLAALSLRDQADPTGFIEAFGGSHWHVVDYLAEQVLLKQPPEIQDFLLQTSVLERLSEPLCEAIWRREAEAVGESGESRVPPSPRSMRPVGAILEYLERGNLFLTALDQERRWYRYHPLFAEFLRQRLRRLDPQAWAGVHRRAAEWCERNGLIAEAVDHALALGDLSQAASLVEQIAETIWMNGEMGRLLGWLGAFPDELIHTRPRLCIIHAWLLNIRGEFHIRDERLGAAQRYLARHRGSRALDPVRGMLAAARAIVAIMENQPGEAMASCRQALKFLPDSDPIWRGLVYRNLGNAYLLDGQFREARLALIEAHLFSQRVGNIYLALIVLNELAYLDVLEGQLAQAYRRYQQALGLSETRGSPGLTITGALYAGLSEVLYEWNDLGGARKCAESAIELAGRDGSLGVRLAGTARLAYLARASGDLQGQAETLGQAFALAPKLQRTSILAHQDAQARLWACQDDRAGTARWLEECGVRPGGPIDTLREVGYLTLARLLIAEGKFVEAIALLDELQAHVLKTGSTGRLVEILALRAVASHALGAFEQALDSLRKSLALAEPGGYVRVFLDEGDSMRTMLRAVSKDAPAALRHYVERITQAFDGERQVRIETPPAERYTGRPAHPIERLSPRELDILRLMASGLTTQDIARQLYLAPSTVRWYTKGIYGKLNVHSRTQASRQARELGLLV
jgi:LuxR family maltose regulon positive regulatory protein